MAGNGCQVDKELYNVSLYVVCFSPFIQFILKMSEKQFDRFK